MTTATPTRTENISWGRLTDERPILAHLLDTARRLKRRSPGYCANRTFYCIFKPIIVRSVGWESKPTCGLHGQTLDEIRNNVPLEHTDRCREEWAKQCWLQTSEAYEFAYHHILDALPNCQHEVGLCW